MTLFFVARFPLGIVE